MKKRILITGGSGFIGSNLKVKLDANEFEILSVGRNGNENISVDLSSETLKKIVQEFSPDIVCHFASGSNIRRAEEYKEKEFNDTVIATKNLLDSIVEAKLPTKVIYLSSQAVYGIPNYLPIDEEHLANPTTVYGKNKLECEKLIIQSSLQYLIFRVSSLYGFSQSPQKSGVIASFINKLKNNEPPIIYNSPDLVFDFIYIKDLTNLLLKGINSQVKNQVFNVGSSKPASLKELLSTLYKYFPNAPKPKLENSNIYPAIDHKGLYFNISKVKKELNWNLQYNLEDGIKELLQNTIREKVTTQQVPTKNV